MKTLLAADEISVHYGKRVVLEKVSLRLAEGEHVALIGPNGAGKSTLLRCLGGLCPFRYGSIVLQGRPIQAYTPKELAACVSYVPQQYNIAFRYSVFDFVAMARYPHLGPWSSFGRADTAKVEEALAMTGSSDLAQRMLAELSGGEKQLVLLSAALAQETPVLLLDEPMSGLDPRHQDAIQELLGRMQREYRKALITATHELNSAALTADRLLALKGGRVLFDAPPRESMTEVNLAALYDKRFVLVRHPASETAMVLPGNGAGRS